MRRDQLMSIGYALPAVERLVAASAVTTTRYSGVHRAAGAPATEEAAAWLAVLGLRAVLPYLSAAQWWELPVPYHATAPRSSDAVAARRHHDADRSRVDDENRNPARLPGRA